tara:strand:- start:9724 stop:10017 length:294 start_codon:yes stop_codon:yes gene_type:complete
MEKNYVNLGKAVGELITEKQKAYGDSFHKSGEVLSILYPNGVNPEGYTDLLAITRILDKLFRIATDPTYGNESPWRDIAGYSLLRLSDNIEETREIE